MEMRVKNGRALLSALILIAALAGAVAPQAAWAVSLQKYSSGTEAKKVVLTFKFSDKVEYEPVFHYKDNFVALKVKGLRFSKNQSRNGNGPSGKEQKACFSKVSYNASGDSGVIKISLSKQRTPGDVQIAPDDQQIRVEILLPTALAKPGGSDEPMAAPAHHGGSQPAADSGGEDEEGPSTWPPPGAEDSAAAEEDEAGEPAADSSSGDGMSEADAGAEEDSSAAEDSGTEEEEPGPGSAEDSGATEPGGFRSTGSEEDSGLKGAPTTPEDSGAESAGEPVDTAPSYKQFDLSSVAAADQEFANLPLNEAVMRLVAGTGFNVVVGSGVADTPTTLSFRQNRISLKRALDALCMAYDLSYSIEDSAIIIRGAGD